MKKSAVGLFLLFLLTGLVSCAHKNPLVEIVTAKGRITVELYIDKAPVTAGRFLELARKGIYDGGSFYRTVNGANDTNPVLIKVIQGGISTKKDVPELSPIRHETTEETGVKHVTGTISMARNKPGSARSEFFICLRGEPELDFGGLRNPDGQGFAAFGKVVDGMSTVLKIYQSTARGQRLDPLIPIEKMSVK
ncbi:MAG: peptidylprolyl isomerase [Bacteroidales bacterium]|nr:peptidylprolyl isomerase [Bacteroidales bacterium]